MPEQNNRFLVVIIALLVINMCGMILFYCINKQHSNEIIKLLSAQESATKPEIVPSPSSHSTTLNDDNDLGLIEYKQYRIWDLVFSYPETFTVVKYADEFNGQTNVRLTSQPGTLFRSAGGPMQPTTKEFTSGYQMTIGEIIPGQDPVGSSRLIETSNPLVKKIDFECNEAGCDYAQYILKTRSATYLITVNTVDYEWAAVYTDGIISSIRE